jgi:hypothetical protein
MSEEKQHAKQCKSNNIMVMPSGHAFPEKCDCDGYHTFGELYEHRIAIFITLCKLLKRQENAVLPPSHPDDSFVWRSKLHSDGTAWEDWFVLGIGIEKGEQITYHLPMSKWDETNFASDREKAPEWDDHTPPDVLERLKKL